MEKIVIDNIEIYFKKTQTNQIEHIKRVISNNKKLFHTLFQPFKAISLIPSEEDDILYIENFDDFFKNMIISYFKDIELDDSLDSDLLATLYIEKLIREKSTSLSLIEPNPNFDDETIDNIIAWKYYQENGTIDELIEYLKYRKDSDIILKWLQSKTRFKAYNYLLEIIVDFLKKYDFSFLKNISDIVKKMLNETFEDVTQKRTTKCVTNDNLPPFSEEEVYRLFNEFLEFIDAPNDWKKMYQDLRNSSKIIFEPKNDLFDNSMCYEDEDGTIKILIQANETLSGFCSLVHEFIHYVTMQNKVKVTQFSISEFPSIFFEKISAEFLKRKGYQETAVNFVLEERHKNNLEICKSLSVIFSEINQVLNGEKIEREEKIVFWKNYFKSFQSAKEKIAQMAIEAGNPMELEFLEPPKVDIEKCIDEECDILIDLCIESGLLIIDGYQYLLGTYLGNEVLKLSRENTHIIPKMIAVTNRLIDINLMDILNLFNIDSLYEEDNSSNKQKTKMNSKNL